MARFGFVAGVLAMGPGMARRDYREANTDAAAAARSLRALVRSAMKPGAAQTNVTGPWL